jgi:hypothetical protein
LFGATDEEPAHVIKIDGGNRCASKRRTCAEVVVFPDEMVGPGVTAGIEEWIMRLGVGVRGARAVRFVEVASGTASGEVFE